MRILVHGLVQGVGFRPTVWRLAQQHGLDGYVRNDGEGVTIYASGGERALTQFVKALTAQAPALARIDRLVCEAAPTTESAPGFRIEESRRGAITTGVVPDAATCQACRAEVRDPAARRYRYPLTTCTYCGPRLTIQRTIPYDRAGTTMAAYPLCQACSTEYEAPADRRFHAQPIACPACGPQVWLVDQDGRRVDLATWTARDALDAASSLLHDGEIVAIKGLGGIQLACDATQDDPVARLRRFKQREQKPFALMARDLDIVGRYCEVRAEEAAVLESAAAPIVLLPRRPGASLAPGVAPGLQTLGVMLPNTPLHHLLLANFERPIVLTSGNRSEEPQCIDNREAQARLAGATRYFLLHDREIAQRVDDSVTRVMGGVPRVLRRSRGYAPAPIALPAGFERAPAVLGMGGELKNTFCLLARGQATLSHHIGDLEEAATLADYRRALGHYRALFHLTPRLLAIDKHPDYLSAKLGRAMALEAALPLCEVQHHHAHLAACLAENGLGLQHPPVLGIALDGLGYGDDDTLWGGEVCLVDYRRCHRLATLKPVRLLGGAQAHREPWRNTYAHVIDALGWERLMAEFGTLELTRYLAAKPRATLDRMLAGGLRSPLASSCGRLFDAVAAAVGLCRDRVGYEGQAAVALEQVVDQEALARAGSEGGYPFEIRTLETRPLSCLDPRPMWEALLGDLSVETPRALIAARFHHGLARALCRMVEELPGGPRTRVVALSGGVFQNRILFESLTCELEALGYRVLSHAHVPTNDGGLSLGQTVVAAARALAQEASCA